MSSKTVRVQINGVLHTFILTPEEMNRLLTDKLYAKSLVDQCSKDSTEGVKVLECNENIVAAFISSGIKVGRNGRADVVNVASIEDPVPGRGGIASRARGGTAVRGRGGSDVRGRGGSTVRGRGGSTVGVRGGTSVGVHGGTTVRGRGGAYCSPGRSGTVRSRGEVLRGRVPAVGDCVAQQQARGKVVPRPRGAKKIIPAYGANSSRHDHEKYQNVATLNEQEDLESLITYENDEDQESRKNEVQYNIQVGDANTLSPPWNEWPDLADEMADGMANGNNSAVEDIADEDEENGLYWFTDARTYLLIETYSKLGKEFAKPQRQPMKLWSKVEATMEGEGAKGVTGRMCRDKFKNLKSRYKKIISRQGSTGAGGGSKWTFFDRMDEILKRDVAVNPDNVVEVGAGYNRIKLPSDFLEEGEDEDCSPKKNVCQLQIPLNYFLTARQNATKVTETF